MLECQVSFHRLFYILVLLVASIEILSAKPSLGLQEETNFLIQSDFKDPSLSIPDSAVWDATGSGSGNEDEDEAKADKDSETRVNKLTLKESEPEIQPNSDHSHIAAGKTEVEVVEVKDDNEQPEPEAKVTNTDHVSNAVTEVFSREETLPQAEAKPASDIEAKPASDIEAKPASDIEGVRAQSATVSPTAMPKFETVNQEIRWKFNKARNSLKKAKQYVELAELIAKKKHRKATRNEKDVKSIISKTEVALVHAGEKIGLDYVHYKRSIPDDEDDYE